MWTRHVFVGASVVLAVVLVASSVVFPDSEPTPAAALLWSAVYVLVPAWYVYRKRNVVAYYARRSKPK